MSDLFYKAHWNEQEFCQHFLKFKQFLAPAEEEIAERSADLISKKRSLQIKNILDIGIGDGSFSLSWLFRLTRGKVIQGYVGIDISPTLLEQAKAKETKFLQQCKEVTFHNIDAVSFIPNKSFDLIVSFNAWYGIPLEKIKEYMNFLNPGGSLVILLNSEQSITLDLTRTFIEKVLSAEELISWLKTNEIDYRAVKLSNTSWSRENFMQNKDLNPNAESFFQYVLRGTKISKERIVTYADLKKDAYFRMPQYVIIIKKDS